MSLKITARNYNNELSVTEHDFGIFKEETGRQTFDFIVTNTGSDHWLFKMLLHPADVPHLNGQKTYSSGGKGKITAIYDPEGRPGIFNKTTFCVSNTNPAVTVVLIIKGEVIPNEKTIEDLFTFAVGPVRFESNHLAFTNVKKTEKKIRVMQVINTSAEPVKLEFDESGSSYF